MKRLIALGVIAVFLICIKVHAFETGWQDNTGWVKNENTVSLQVTSDTIGVGTVHISGELQLIGIGTTNQAHICVKNGGAIVACN